MNIDKKKEKVSSIIFVIIFILLYVIGMVVQFKTTFRQTSPNVVVLGLVTGSEIIMSMLIVIFAPYKKIGAIAMTIVNLLNAGFSFAVFILSSGQSKSGSGIIIEVISITVSWFISYYYQKARDVNEVVKKKYDELSETHRVLEDKQRKLQYMVYYDVLTDMPNRQRFMEEIDVLAKDSKSPFTVIIASINNMKSIANKYGNTVSDKVINTFASRIKDYCGNSIFASRFSSDEFGFIIKGNLSSSNKMMFIQMIQSKLTDPITIDSNSVQFSCNMGVSAFPDDSDSPSDILKYAESALTFSKNTGENLIFVSHKDVAVRVNV